MHRKSLASYVPLPPSCSSRRAGRRPSHSNNQAGGPYVGIGAGEMLPGKPRRDQQPFMAHSEPVALHVEDLRRTRRGLLRRDQRSQGCRRRPRVRLRLRRSPQARQRARLQYVFGERRVHGCFYLHEKTRRRCCRCGTAATTGAGPGASAFLQKKHGFYIEASYVSFQTNPNSDFIPVVVGFNFDGAWGRRPRIRGGEAL